ncbi:MAG: RDD family protein [Candidatus Woesearchaeota archaeon]
MNENVSFWKRMFALIIDLIIVNMIIIYPFRSVFIKYFGNITLKQSVQLSEVALPSIVYWVIMIISILTLIYFTFFDYYLSQTPGKMLFKLKSISLKNKNRELNLGEALLKNCFALPFFPFYIFWIIDPIYLIFYKERFLEKITSTKTVYESDKNIKKTNNYDEYKLSKV